MRHTFLKTTQVRTAATHMWDGALQGSKCCSCSTLLCWQIPVAEPVFAAGGPIPLPHICGEKGGRSSQLLHAHLRPKKCTLAPFSKETFVSVSFLDISLLLPVTGRQRASRCWAEPLLRLSVSTVSQPSSWYYVELKCQAVGERGLCVCVCVVGGVKSDGCEKGPSLSSSRTLQTSPLCNVLFSK